MALCKFFRQKGYEYQYASDDHKAKRAEFYELVKQYVNDNSATRKTMLMANYGTVPYVSVAIVYDIIKDFIAVDTKRRIVRDEKYLKTAEEHFIDAMKEAIKRLPFRLPGMSTYKRKQRDEEGNVVYLHGWDEALHTMGGGSLMNDADYCVLVHAFKRHGLILKFDEYWHDFAVKFRVKRIMNE